MLLLVGSPAARAVATSLALAGVAFSAYLLVVQIAVIGEVCDWCLVNDGIVTVLAALLLANARSYVSMSPASSA